MHVLKTQKNPLFNLKISPLEMGFKKKKKMLPQTIETFNYLYSWLKTEWRNFCLTGHELNWVPSLNRGADPVVHLRLALRWTICPGRQADGPTYLLALRPRPQTGWGENWRISISVSWKINTHKENRGVSQMCTHTPTQKMECDSGIKQMLIPVKTKEQQLRSH